MSEDLELGKDYPRIKGRCPSCGAETLFRGHGGYITCSVIGCKEPAAASDLLAGAAPTPPPATWQPIETAPKERRVLVRTTKRVGEAFCYERALKGWYWVQQRASDPSEVPIRPIAWMPLDALEGMPLPPPPSSPAQREEPQ